MTYFRLFQTERVCRPVTTISILQTSHHNFNFDLNGKTFSKRVENTMGKGKIACYEQFLAPLAVGQRAYVMVCCPSCVCASVCACVNFFFKSLLL